MSSTIHPNALRTFALAGFVGWASLSLPTTVRAQIESVATVPADSITTRSAARSRRADTGADARGVKHRRAAGSGRASTIFVGPLLECRVAEDTRKRIFVSPLLECS